MIWKKIAGLVWYIELSITYFALALNSFRNPKSFMKLTGVDSEVFILVAFISTYFICKYDIYRLPSIILHVLKVIFPVALIVGAGLTIVDALTPPNFVYNLTTVNYQRITYMAVLSGWLLLWHAEKTWLQKKEEKLFFISGVVLLVLAGLLSFWPFDVFIKMSEEDHLIENAQAVALFIAGIYAFRIARAFFKRKLTIAGGIYLFAAIILLAVSGDEIAWGQRFLGLATPSFFQSYNAQHEVTVHNLAQFPLSVTHLYMAVALWGWGSWLITDKFRKNWHPATTFFISQWYLFPYFFSTFVYEFRISLGPHNIGVWSEMMELMLYLGTCFFILQNDRHFAEQLDSRK